jgi:hypothetical protein
VYGIWMFPLKSNLPIAATFPLTIAVLAAMVWLCHAEDRWRGRAKEWRTRIIAWRPARLRTLLDKVPLPR